MGILQDRVALVTGASRGIGRAIARRLAAENAQVVLTGRDENALAEAVAEIRADGGAAEWLAADLRDDTAAEMLVAFTQERCGALDILVNNAGATKRGRFADLTDAEWQDGFALKFFGAVRLTRAAWPLLAARHGSLMNIAGIGGRTPGAEFSVGGSVNAALLAFTKSLADQGIADGIQVNAINPGPVRTARLASRLAAISQTQDIDMAAAEAAFIQDSQISRIGEPEDIANLAAFILSPAGSLLHGALIDMDGGQTKTL
jgi:NAD(P)-dependent dehydrogenase (short-subunit alcohol dehydrogenase family)